MKSPAIWDCKSFLFSTLFVLFILTLSAQKDNEIRQDVPITVTSISTEDLVNKGVFNIDLSSDLNFLSSIVNVDGDRVSNNSAFNVHLRGGGNLVQNFNIRGLVDIGTTSNTPESSRFTTSVFNAVAGIDIERIEVLRGPQGVLFGANFSGGVINTSQEREEETVEFNQNTIKFGLRLGTIIPLGDPHVAVVPSVGYFNEKFSFDDGEETCSGVRINAGLRTYFECPWKDLFHKGPGSTYKDGKYDVGSMVLSGKNHFNWDLGSINSTFTSGGEDFESDQSKSELDIQFNGAYFFSPGIAAIATLNYDRGGFSDDDFSRSDSEWGIRLGVEYHLPENLENVFVYGKVGLGGEGFTYEFDSPEQSDSQSGFQYGIGAGVYHHILPRVAIKLSGAYSSLSIGDPTRATSNLSIGTGLVTFIGSNTEDAAR